MESDLTQVGDLLRLLEEREQVVENITAHILDKLKPNLLDVLSELFGLPQTDIDWLDVQCIDTVLLVICAINYDPNTATAYLRKLFANSSTFDSVDENIKMIRIGIPLANVFGPREEIIKFLQEVVDDAVIEKIESTVENSKEISDNTSFDTSKLSQEQIQQLSMFTNQGKGAKH